MVYYDLAFYALVFLQLADLVTTVYGIEKGASEYNKFLRKIFAKVPPIVVLVILKGAFCYFAYWLYKTDNSIEAQRVIGIMAVFYIALLINNVIALKKIRELNL